MPTLITTPGAENANSYATVAEADLYHSEEVLYSSAWDSASTTQKEKSLIISTRILDDTVEWKGVPSSTGQSLLWPRQGVLTKVSAMANGQLWPRTEYIKQYNTGGILNPLGVELPTDEIPQFLKNATAELARTLLESDRVAEQDSGAVNSISIPGLSVSMGGGGSGRGATRPLLSPRVYDLINFYSVMVKGYSPSRVVRT
jgi:hypothetical protein